MRVLWLARELGLEFDHVGVTHDDPYLKTGAFLALNPGGTIPTIVDDDFALSESLAITLYLAKRYGNGNAPLYPADAHGEALTWRWSLWAQGHLEPWLQRDAVLAAAIEALGDHAQAMVDQSLRTLNRALQGRPWLLGADFTVADLNVAAVLSPSRAAALDLSPYEPVVRWLSACYARPACRAARDEFLGAGEGS